MSFLQKFFTHNIYTNKTDNELKVSCEPLNFRSSNLSISKDQIRFLLFRECDRRGRKLLFDSKAVEKVPLSYAEANNKKCPLAGVKRNSDYIETTATHGYKYKKLSDDVSCFGEMIFGSVAMTYKGENSCKIHKIPSSKKLMFTTIIHAPVRCHISAISECSSESSSTSIKDASSQKETSSSDSKLYRPTGVAHKCSSTYPCSKNAPGLNKLIQCCDVSEMHGSPCKNSHSSRDIKGGHFEGLSVISDSSEFHLSKETKSGSDLEQDFLILNYSHKASGCEQNSGGNTNSAASMVSSDSENVSSVSGSLGSLRRRWAQSNSTWLDMTSQEDVNSTPSKKRTKLGMALVLDMNDSNDKEMETFLFNHTILIDSIMNKLQSSIESAYVKNQNFVDLLHTAFLDTQQSIYDLIKNGKYAVPFWIGLLGDPDDSEGENKGGDGGGGGGGDCSSTSFRTGTKDSKFSIKQLSSPIKLKRGTSNEPGSSNNAKIKFLNDFHDVLVRFDTKDTNFFISTLLTAVLTHHLSWVNAIAETDNSNRHEKVQSVIKNYNPIWAQLNDLCGLLGSPLKCAKTIVKGDETKKCYITAILQVLTYFIRCFNVVENVYDVSVEDVVGGVENWVEVADFRGGFHSFSDDERAGSGGNESNGKDSVFVENYEGSKGGKSMERFDVQKSLKSEGSLRRNKVSSSRLNVIEEPNEFYPDVRTLTKVERTGESDSTSENVEEVEVEVPNTCVVTNGNRKRSNRRNLSPDEVHEATDSGQRENFIDEGKNDMKNDTSNEGNAEKEIVFLLGDNDKLVNLRKKRVDLNKSETIELEKKDLNESAEKVTKSSNETYPLGEDTCQTLEESLRINEDDDDKGNRRLSIDLLELNMPKQTNSSHKKHLDVSSVFGGVNDKYNSEQIIQGLVEAGDGWEENLERDLYLSAYNSIVEKNVKEALCIIGDMDSWEVSVRSSKTSALEKKKSSGVRVCMSQLVADMLESFLIIRKINLSPNFCFLHIEKKLREIYLKSKTVAELLISTELCTIEYLTTRLDIGINDIPLLLSVATTHSPQISDKYGLSFT